MPASIYDVFTVDGTVYGPFQNHLFLPDYPSSMLLTEVQFGATGFDSGFSTDLDIRNPILGTEGFGSSDLWAPVFTNTAVPPFDSVVGTGLTVSGGVITVTNAGTRAYGVHAFASGLREVYVQYELRVRLPLLSVSDSMGFHEFFNQLGSQVNGLASGPFDGGHWEDFWGDNFGPGHVTNVWATIQHHIQIIGGIEGITFSGMPVHRAAPAG